MKKVCILGSGVSGSILAKELSDKFDVTVVDCDKLDLPFNNETSLEKFLDSNLKKQKFVGYGFGGTTNLWHGVLTQMDPEDIKAISDKTGLNLNKELKEKLHRLEEYFGDLSFLNDGKLDKNKLSQFMDLESLGIKKYVHMTRPARFRKIIRLLKNRGRINTMECAVATSLHFEKDSDVVKYLKIRKNGKEKKVFSDLFIVATGGLESPRLLLQSFENSRHHNVITGTGLMDHPHTTIGSFTIPKYIFYTQHGTRSVLFSNSSRVGYTIPKKYRRLKNLNHSLYIRPSLVKNIDQVKEDIKLLISSKFSFNLLLKILSRPTLLLSAFILLSERFGFGIYTNLFNIHMHLEQSIDNCSSVTLSHHEDRHGRRIPKIHRSFSEDSIKDILHIQSFVKDLIGDSCTFRGVEITKRKLDSGAHFSGTCRLGKTQKNSVVDKNLKYHSMKNLFVCDASVIPKTGNSNLSLTIALLALRLSDYLNKKYNGENKKNN